MDILKQLEKVMNQIEKIDYTKVDITIETQTDRYIMNKEKPKNPIGFRMTEVKGGE